MQRFKEAEVQVKQSINFVQSITGTFPDVLTKIILEYFKETFVSTWKEGILDAMEKKDGDLVLKGRKYHPQFVEQFKIVFLTTLAAIDLNPNLPVKLDFPEIKHTLTLGYYNKELHFDNALQALSYILFNNEFNLEMYLGLKLAPRNENDFELLKRHRKALLLLIPGVQEHILTESDMVILLDILRMNQLDLNTLRSKLVKSGQTAIRYLEPEQKIYSLVTTGKNSYARELVLDIQRSQKDVEEYENRLGASTMNILETLNLLPKVLNNLVAQYARDEEYIISLAKKVLEQLGSLKIKYKDRFEALGADPDVLSILEETLQAITENKSVRYYWGGRNPHAFEWPEDYEYKAIKVLQRLINGVQIMYGSSEETLGRFEEKSETGLFYLLKFFKDFTLKQADPAVDQFILDLLELANTHTPIKVNKSSLQKDCKVFSSIGPSTPLSVRMSMEKELNKFLEAKTSVKWPVNYITMEKKSESDVILYVQSQVKTAQEILARYSVVSIHLSPLFIHKLLEMFDSGAHRAKWGRYKEDERGAVIKSYISKDLGVPAQDVPVTKFYGHYGYEVKMQSGSYAMIQSRLFNQGQAAESNPTGTALLKLIQKLEVQLKTYKKGSDSHIDKVLNYVNAFKKDFARIAKITDSEEALKEGVDFLKYNILQLKNILKDSTSLAGLYSHLPSTLKETLSTTIEDMKKLQESMVKLVDQLAKGNVALTLCTLPSA